MKKRWTFLGLAVLVLTGVVIFAGQRLTSIAKDGDRMSTTRDSSFFAATLHDTYSEGMPKVVKSDAEWRKILTPEQYHIAREQGTERPFCGLLNDEKRPGIYSCICCGLPLFSSDAKFHSGTGWPSFFQPVRKEHISEVVDRSWGTVRTEIECARCGAHLGHVFDDGPRPTGLRYCLNSESLFFTGTEK
jgi:methionine-R-sulfoxide reductase